MTGKRGLFAILLAVVVSLPAGAQENPSLKADILVNADIGWPTTIIITGYNPQEKAWLGLSLYPYNVSDPVTGGTHRFFELPKGPFREEVKIEVPLLGGSFETALWGKRVDKVDCTIDNCYWCKTYGFHLDQMLVYKSGLLTRLTGYGQAATETEGK